MVFEAISFVLLQIHLAVVRGIQEKMNEAFHSEKAQLNLPLFLESKRST